MLFLLLYGTYLTLGLGLSQRLFIWPVVSLMPWRRHRVMGPWLRLQARATLGMLRTVAGVRVSVNGSLPDASIVVVMNHQSLLDIPLGIRLMPGPQPLIPTRVRYKHGIPGISLIGRLARFPFVSQAKVLPRNELREMSDAVDRVARGECSMLIFPEGHRSRSGAIGPFMRAGLRLVLSRANRPVYAIVSDGASGSRRAVDAVARLAGTRVVARVIGPFEPPREDELDAFITSLRRRMQDTLDEMRRAGEPRPASGVA